MKGWQIVYVFTGSFTVLLAIGVLCILPDNPMSAWWLTKEEKVLAVERIRSNQQAAENKVFKVYQAKEALMDVNTWLYALFSFSTNIPNGA